MRHTLVGVYERHEAAAMAAQALRDSGFDAARVQVTTAVGELSRAGSSDDGVAAHVRSFFAELFGPAHVQPVDVYAETVRRGGALVTVGVHDERELERARLALQRCGAATIDERVGTTAGGGAP